MQDRDVVDHNLPATKASVYDDALLGGHQVSRVLLPAALSLRVSVQIFSTLLSDRQATALRLTTPRSPTINGSLCAGPPTTIIKNNRKFITLASLEPLALRPQARRVVPKYRPCDPSHNRV